MSEANGPIHFRRTVKTIAGTLLSEWVGEERASEAVGRITAALASTAAAARDPAAFYACTPASIATSVALAALTSIMPGTGSNALAYLVPQSPRKGEPPQLQYRLSHRGINALARRCGQTLIAIPVSMTDRIEPDGDGGCRVVGIDVDNPPLTWDELRGVALVVKQLDNGLVVHRGWVAKKIIESRRAVSASWQNEKARAYSPWTTWPVEMALKTAMHYGISRGWCVIDDTTAMRALSADQQDAMEVPTPAPALFEAPGPGRHDLKAKDNGATAPTPLAKQLEDSVAVERGRQPGEEEAVEEARNLLKF